MLKAKLGGLEFHGNGYFTLSPLQRPTLPWDECPGPAKPNYLWWPGVELSGNGELC